MDFQNKTVVITGASGGIGLAAARLFAAKGARMVLASRDPGRLEKARAEVSELGPEALAVRCDVSVRSDVENMCAEVLEKAGRVDVLVNNAGFAIYGYVADLSIEEIESQMATNYFGMVYCTKCILPALIAQGSGHIVNVASVAGSFGLPGIAPYCASKHAMLGFSEGLWHELRGTGVGVTVVSPIMVRTGFFEHPSFRGMPRRTRMSLSPERVAGSIVRAAGSPRLEIIVPGFVRGAVWAKHTLPYLVNPAVASSFRRPDGA